MHNEHLTKINLTQERRNKQSKEEEKKEEYTASSEPGERHNEGRKKSNTSECTQRETRDKPNATAMHNRANNER